MRFTVEAALIISLILVASEVGIKPSAYGKVAQTSQPRVYVYPSRVVDVNLTPSKSFTVEVKIADVTDLKGFDIQLNWNASLLNCASYVVKVPVEDYPGGVLHRPVMQVRNEVNATSGTCRVAFATVGGSPFSGGGTVFSISFTVINYGKCVLDISSSDLSDSEGQPISHTVEDGYFSNIELNHDVAVLSLAPCKTIVFKGYYIHVNVTLENQGNTIESFNVTLYANDVAVGKIKVNLNEGETATVTFVWNTASAVEYEVYTIRATADQVPGETDVGDNSLYYEGIRVVHPGDFDADMDVDIFDIVSIASGYGSRKGDSLYNPNLDGDCDGDIDIFDVVRIAPFYGYKRP